MDESRIIWDAANRKHLGEGHPERQISIAEIEEVLADTEQITAYLEARQAYETLGRTRAGRRLLVAWIEQPEGKYPIHARQAGRRTIRRRTQ